MITITLPDQSRREFPAPVTVAEVAASIGSGLAKAALAGRLGSGTGSKVVDTSHRIEQDTTLAIITDKDADGLDVIRHSTAHLLAYAVKTLFPDAQVTIGPVIDNGFYYDFSYHRPFTPEDLAAIEAKMGKGRVLLFGPEILQRAQTIHGQIRDWRRSIHRYPELTFTEQRTAALVNATLVDLGIASDGDQTCGRGCEGQIQHRPLPRLRRPARSHAARLDAARVGGQHQARA